MALLANKLLQSDEFRIGLLEKHHIAFNNKTILVTGGASFIGSYLIIRLLKDMHSGSIVNIDCRSDYNPIELEEYRLKLVDDESKNFPVNHIFDKH